jgi:PAS domain S-box-containing protein
MALDRTRSSWTAVSPGSPLHTVILVCLVGVLSYLVARLGGALVLRPQMLWPLWPGCAFLVAVLLLAPRRIWPVLIAGGLAGFVVYDLQAGLTLRSTAFLILADAIEILIAALGVSYAFNGLPRLNSIESLARYSFFAVVLAPLVVAFIGTTGFVGNYSIRWRIGFFTEALALLTVTPAILAWASTGQAWLHHSRAFYFEAATLIAGLSFWGYFVLVAPPRSSPVLVFSLLPFLLWSALRFGLMGTSTSMIVIGFLSIWGAVHGSGPFTGGESINNVMSLQLFLFFAATPFMILAVLAEEQKQTEQTVREGENRFRLVADTAPVLIWMADADKLCTYFNKPWLDFTGRSIDLELGNGWAEGVHPEDLRRCMDTYCQAFDRREEFRMEYRLRRHDGEYRWIIDIGVPRFNQDRSFTGYIGIGVDVTERKHAEQALRESEERFRLATHAGKMFAYEWDAATDVIVRSGDCAEILGLEKVAHVTTGQQILAKVHPDDRENLVAADAALSAEKPHLQVSHRMIRPDGSVIWVERTSRAHFDEQGKVLRIVGMVADITERKVAERKLALANDRLRLAMESGKSVGWEWDLRSGRDTWFGDLQTMFGMSSDTFVGRSEDFYRYVHPEDRHLVAVAVAEARESRKPYATEFRIVWPDGTLRWVAAKGKFHYSPDGEAERMLGMAIDITERRQAEESLRLFRKLIDESNDAFAVVDPETLRFLDVNERACRDLGYTRDELLSRSVPDIDPTADEFVLTRLRTELEVSGCLRFETVHRRKDGSTFPVEINVTRVELDRVYSVSVVRDITERRRVEKAVRQKDIELMEAQRLAQVGSWQWDIQNDIVIWSEELYRINGRDPMLPAPAYKECRSLLSAESWERLQRAAEATIRDGRSYELDLELIRPDGSTRWVTNRAEAVRDSTGRIVRLRGTTQDITERKLSQEALHESEDKLRLLLDSTAEAIYGIDLEDRCTFCNPACLRALGYERADQLLGKNMHDLIHHTRADGTVFPVEECPICRVLRNGEGVHVDDEVLWRAHGTSFPAEYWSYPQRRGQEVVGAVVAFIDITQRKLAEAALASVSRRLIEAQEQERTRIARELHDDFAQRLALLAVELEQIHQDPPDLPEVRRRVGELHKQTAEIAIDIQTLSHELHSAKLQVLGIAAAMRGFCREFGEQTKVKIDFNSHDLPSPLSPDISLCLFRVLQEALHNSAKHSGVRYVEIELWGASDEIHLTVSDLGAGFDSEAAKQSRGLGLISMEERLKLVKGTISIDSQRKRGTTIRARVPLSSGGHSMRATG